MANNYIFEDERMVKAQINTFLSMASCLEACLETANDFIQTCSAQLAPNTCYKQCVLIGSEVAVPRNSSYSQLLSVGFHIFCALFSLLFGDIKGFFLTIFKFFLSKVFGI